VRIDHVGHHALALEDSEGLAESYLHNRLMLRMLAGVPFLWPLRTALQGLIDILHTVLATSYSCTARRLGTITFHNWEHDLDHIVARGCCFLPFSADWHCSLRPETEGT